MCRSCFFLILWLLSGPLTRLHAQWSMDMKNRLGQGGENAWLYLAYEAPADIEKEFVATVNLRPAGRQQVYIHREVALRTQGSQTFAIGFRLPQGSYDVDVDIYDRRLNEHSYLKRPEAFQLNRRREVLLSDIFLGESPDTARIMQVPFLRPEIDLRSHRLYYAMDIYAPEYDALTVRAVLYREQQNAPQSTHTSAYVSLQQSVQVVYPGGRPKVTFLDTLFIDRLAPDDYMVQVLVYDEEYRIADEQIWFVVGGDIQQRIFGNLDESIRMMRYMLAPQQLYALLEKPDSAHVRANEFTTLWRKRYHEDYIDHMEAYFRKVYAADARFAEGKTAGWETDRGRTFIQYGEPRVKEERLAGRTYERWTYARWGLSFLFEQRNQRYFLVE
ncbi:MAG: hypothetical protein OHK0039_36190 [Bacteroidia bacterium]